MDEWSPVFIETALMERKDFPPLSGALNALEQTVPLKDL